MTRVLACALACALIALAPAGCGSDDEDRPGAAREKATQSATPESEKGGGEGSFGY